MELEFRHLRVLVAVADEGSISRAAAALGMSQPSLTAQVQRIERALGAPLFERGRTGVVPTGYGRTVVAKARVMVGEMEGLRRTSPPPPGDSAEIDLHLGFYPSPLASCVAPRLEQAHERPLRVHPHTDYSSADLLARLRAARLDAAVVREVVGFEMTPPEGLHRETVVPVEPRFVALSEEHPLAGEDEIDLAALADENWLINPLHDAELVTSLRWACGQAGFEPRITHEIAAAASAREFIATGQCVSMAQAMSTEADGLVIRPLLGDPLTFRVVLVWRSPGPVEPVVLRRVVAAAYRSLTCRNPGFARWWAKNGVPPVADAVKLTNP